MRELDLLLVESSGWANACAAWLAERDFRVEVASDWPSAGSILRHRNHHLVLVDESLWSVDPRAARELLEQDRDVVILATDYNRDGFTKALEGGATGYINKNLDQDTFIRELEKVLRRVGLTVRRGRVLVVDNDPHVLSAVKNSLEREGYQVYTANTAEDALDSIVANQPHVAVIDIRLKDDDDRLDQSGFALIEEIGSLYGHAVRIVGLTGSPVRRTAQRAVGRVSRFVLKETKSTVPDDALVTAIEEALEELGLNQSLQVEFEDSLSWQVLVKMMKDYRDQQLDQEQWKKAIQELQDLLQKLFRRELKVKAYYLNPGRGGSGVMLVRPIVEGTKGEYLVVKFGPRDKIATELRNYDVYVKPFVGRRCTHLVDIVDEPISTLNLGGLKFSFAGMSRDKPQDLHHFFRDPGTKPEGIRHAMRYLIKDACRKWYAAKHGWSDDNGDALAKAYESHLSLDRSHKRDELEIQMERLLDGRAEHGISFTRHGRDNIEITLAGAQLVFPNPLRFVSQYRTRLPVPRFQCRLHGDLNGRNIFVDVDYSVWLIDFFRAGWGPLLLDLNQLETVVKFELMDTSNLAALYDFEKMLLAPGRFDEKLTFVNRFRVMDMEKALAAVEELRTLALEESQNLDTQEYYAGLLFFALRMVTWEGISSTEKDRYPVRQRHAALSAAMIAYRLENWDRWEGWPGDRESLLTP